MNKQSLPELKERAVKLIARHVGATTARMYGDLYSNKNADYIYMSMSSLLTEILGAQTAMKELKQFSITRRS